MSKELVVKKTLELDADISKDWDALTNPELTKQYFFGCEAISWEDETRYQHTDASWDHVLSGLKTLVENR